MASVPVSSRRNQLLEWFPFYVHRLVGDVRYRALKDYQQAWYLNLLFASWVSERPGYLPDDGQLWRLANARTRQFFEKECEPILCMFEREGSMTDGAVWIYNRVLLEIYDEQVLKFHKRRRKSSKSTDDNTTSYLDFEGTLKKENGREECKLHPESGLTQWGTCWECYAEIQGQSTDNFEATCFQIVICIFQALCLRVHRLTGSRIRFASLNKKRLDQYANHRKCPQRYESANFYITENSFIR